MTATLITHALAALLIVCGGCAQSQIASSESEGPYATAAAGTPLEHMKLAEVSGKIGVPVEVRYLLSGEPVRDQLMGFELAVAPRVEGQNLKIEFPESSSVSLSLAPITQQKADPKQVIRRKVLVTPLTDGDGEIRVLVSMDAQGGRFFGVFSIPVRR